MPRLRLEPRAQASRLATYLSPVLAVVLTLIGAAVLFAILGRDPIRAYQAFFIDPISTFYGAGELGVKSAPLILCAIGLAIGFRANVWNIGAEGQFILGGICGSYIALFCEPMLGPATLPVMFVAGALGGLIWAAIPALLKTQFNANEILTSLMLTYVAQLLLNFLVRGPWRNPQGYNFPQSKSFDGYAVIEPWISGTRVGLGTALALVAVAFGWFIMSRSFLGYQIKVIGLTPAAATYAGFSAKRVTWFCLLLSGGLAGIAGINEVAGPIGQLLPVISPGYGFTAIIVAFLGRLNPVGIVLAGLLIALSYLGGEAAQISLDLPVAVVGVFQGMLLFFLLACELLVRYRVVVGQETAQSAA
ncbi:MAG TPA: ABC transporter permease [Stellaceae bacterium]|nr:ABC transporter permease [Stellaceae bacterium]